MRSVVRVHLSPLGFERPEFSEERQGHLNPLDTVFSVSAMYFENCILNQYLEYMILRDNIKENINIQDIRGVTSKDVTKQINVTRREITSNDNLRPEIQRYVS